MVSIFAQLAADARDKQASKDAQVWQPPAFDPMDAADDPVIRNHIAAKGAKKGATITAAGATDPSDSVWMGGWANKDKWVSESPKLPKELQQRADYKKVPAQRELVSVDAALNSFWDWSPQKREQEKQRAARAIGVDPAEMTTEKFLSVWQQAVQWSNKSANSKHPITPFDALDLMARDTHAAVTASGGVKRSVSKSVDEISDGTAWGYLSDAAKQMLGRAPTDAELRRFVGKAHDIASRNPTITTSTQSADGKTSTTEQQSGATGADYAMAAQNMAASDPEAAAYQVAGNYMNVLMDALQSDIELSSPLL